ncbi:MAG TPA: nucleotidyltransferase domain-containing protein [Egibacteraceae bacterium]|nr:nucleotidyltransferase domain-containing protein [Egibacteraceae bacterium]
MIPSLDGPVLAALAGTTQPLSLTRVRAVAGRGSLAGVRRVLLRLVDAGLAEAVPGGYVLNREHVAAPAVVALAGLHGELSARLRGAVAQWDGDCQLLGLFGSAARRDGDETSDIDVLLVSPSGDARDFAEALAADVERWTGNHGHIVVVTPAQLEGMRRVDEPILESWRRDLIVVLGSRSALDGAAS